MTFHGPHRKGEPFEFRHLAEGESLTECGFIRRGRYLIISNVSGYQYMEQFGHWLLSRPMESYSLAKMRATVDALNARIESEPNR